MVSKVCFVDKYDLKQHKNILPLFAATQILLKLIYYCSDRTTQHHPSLVNTIRKAIWSMQWSYYVQYLVSGILAVAKKFVAELILLQLLSMYKSKHFSTICQYNKEHFPIKWHELVKESLLYMNLKYATYCIDMLYSDQPSMGKILSLFTHLYPYQIYRRIH